MLWIGGVGVVTWQNLPQDEYVVPPGWYVAPSEHGSDAAAPSTDKSDDLPPFDPSKPYTTLHDKERWEAVRLASVIALVPPAFVLALGSALVWAFRGFR